MVTSQKNAAEALVVSIHVDHFMGGNGGSHCDDETRGCDGLLDIANGRNVMGAADDDVAVQPVQTRN